MWKKLLMLIAWYIAWSTVTWLYADKKWSEVQKEMKKERLKWWDDKTYFLEYLLNIHKRFFWDVKEKILTPENKEFLETKKEEAMDVIWEYRIEAEKLLEEAKTKWKDYLQIAYKNLEEFSQLKADEGEKRLKDLWKKVVNEFQNNFQQMIEHLKSNYK